MQPPEIRSAHLEDIPALIDLFASVVDERTWLGTEPGFDRERIRAGYTRTIDSDDHLTLVAEAGGALVGTLRLAPTDAGHGLGMLIARGHRGCGLGTRLVDAAIAWARARAGTTISLGVFPHNAAALRLYEKAGFRTVRRLAGAYTRQTGDVWDVIEMEKRIGGAPRFLRAEHVD
jgi:ribosomal protein S18 acetylase RimI-like enzyme